MGQSKSIWSIVYTGMLSDVLTAGAPQRVLSASLPDGFASPSRLVGFERELVSL